MRSPFRPHDLCIWAGPAVIAVMVCFAILLSCDPAGDYPRLFQGPGLTVDESFNVQEGVRLVEAIPDWVDGRLSTRELFGDQNDLQLLNAPLGYHLADHPPLGRIGLGLSHKIACAVHLPRDNDTPFIIACGRAGSAMAFAALVLLVGTVSGRWYGSTAGVTTAVSLVLMPRVFGHAHLAALETMMNFMYAAVVFSVAICWSKQSPPNWKTALFTGLVLGLALLTKIQAILLPFPIAVWALFHWKHRAILPLVIWGITGLTMFFLLWPWLWLNPLEHFSEYFLRTTERVTINVWYFGSKLADKDVPWHYTAVMFLSTIPVGLLLLGFVGWFVGTSSVSEDVERPSLLRDPQLQLVLACLLFPLVLFSLPGVVVYDGVRLFLVVFPLWAVFIGRGSAAVMSRLSQKWSRKVAVSVFVVFLTLQAYGVVAFAPCHLSYYNLLVGGLRGAERLGLEPTYWGDSVTREFLEEVCRKVPEGATVDVMPVLQPTFLEILYDQSPILRSRKINLRPYHPEKNGPPHYVMIYRRKADLPSPLLEVPTEATVLAEAQIQGVTLAALYEFPR